MNLGLVLEGGGGKGSYQIGIWRAMRELGLEEQVTMVSGTSVGSLNAMLFRLGDLALAETLWGSISPQAMLPDGNGSSGQEGIGKLIDLVMNRPAARDPIPCYATCRRSRDGAVCYFELGREADPQRQKQILLASSALPGVYDPVVLDGEAYTDGGIQGDVCPIRPLFDAGAGTVIAIHLRQDWEDRGPWPGTEVVHITPSEDLGDRVTGTLDFDPEHAKVRIALGYRDGMAQLKDLAQRSRTGQ